MKLTAQQAFDRACKDYDSAISLIKEMCSKSETDSEKPLLHFDWTLQAVLLEAALGDGIYMEVENDFIKKITDHGDILDIVNQKSQKNISEKFPHLSWNNLKELIDGLEEDNKSKFIILIHSLILEYTNAFVEYFSKIDALTEFNYIEELDKYFKHIVISLALCDGDDFESEDATKEIFKGFGFINKTFTDVWKAKKEEFQNKNVSTVSSNNSLKEEFKKKRG